jgi:hypothetical protein
MQLYNFLLTHPIVLKSITLLFMLACCWGDERRAEPSPDLEHSNLDSHRLGLLDLYLDGSNARYYVHQAVRAIALQE